MAFKSFSHADPTIVQNPKRTKPLKGTKTHERKVRGKLTRGRKNRTTLRRKMELTDDPNQLLSVRLPEADRQKLQATIDDILANHRSASRPYLLTPEEKAIIIELYAREVGVAQIARLLSRKESSIRYFLRRYIDTSAEAKLHLKAHAKTFADRVVEKADVSESLEVLDRLEVLPKKQQTQQGQQFNVVVGMSGTAGAIPVPPIPALPAAAQEDTDGPLD